MFTKRSESVMLITCWYLCFPVSRALWFAIRCRCLASRCSASSPLTFFMIPSLVLCLCSLFPVLSAFTLILSTISHLWNQPSRARSCSLSRHIHGCVTNFIAFLYIYIYIHTNASSESNCRHQDELLATLGNYGV